jgi:NAD(P)-dependent dehydrogenase (short-subunit alcohol dehydrogenase family)
MVIIFVTGCSTGLGREVALAALARGDKVIATARNVSDIADLAEKGALTIPLDLSKSDHEIQQTVTLAIEPFGAVDILLNNDGAALAGALEEIR